MKPSCARAAGTRRDGRAAEILGRHIPHGLGELPSMPRHFLHGAVPLTVLPVCGRFEHACSVRAGTLELGTDILDPDTDEMHRPTVVCWLPVLAVRDDHCPICADAHLRPVTVAYPRALNETERCAQPRHRGPHVRIGQDGHDGRWRDRPVGLNLPELARPPAMGTAPHRWVLPAGSAVSRSDLDRRSNSALTPEACRCHRHEWHWQSCPGHADIPDLCGTRIHRPGASGHTERRLGARLFGRLTCHFVSVSAIMGVHRTTTNCSIFMQAVVVPGTRADK
jgi:hypothetical protein